VSVAERSRWIALAYAALLVVLLIVRLAIGDRTLWLFIVNAFFLYAFLPLPLLLVAALLTRRAIVVGVFVLAAAVWAWFWGALFLPAGQLHAAGPRLVVLAYNMLGFNRDVDDTLRIIRESAADLVALQELNPETAHAIERELATVYPYRVLEPQIGVDGEGLLSKNPMGRATTGVSRDAWTVPPLTVDLTVDRTRITVVAFHTDAGPDHVAVRERQARTLAEYARRRRTPLVFVGDLNATDQNGAYTLVAEEMRDSWREAGRGFGHTFPGQPGRQVGGSRPTILGVPAPLWLIRIDFIFHSPDLVALEAKTAPYYGRSDHRGVLATLAIR